MGTKTKSGKKKVVWEGIVSKKSELPNVLKQAKEKGLTVETSGTGKSDEVYVRVFNPKGVKKFKEKTARIGTPIPPVKIIRNKLPRITPKMPRLR